MQMCHKNYNVLIYIIYMYKILQNTQLQSYNDDNCMFCKFFLNIERDSDILISLETSAFQSLYGGQFTLSTPLINQIFVFH